MSGNVHHSSFAAQLVAALDPAVIPNLPKRWLDSRAAYLALATVRPAIPSKAAVAQADLVSDVLDRAAHGKDLDDLDMTEMLAAQTDDHHARILAEAITTARNTGRIEAVIACRDELSVELIHLVQKHHVSVTRDLWKIVRTDDLVLTDQATAQLVGGEAARAMATAIDLARQAEALGTTVRLVEDLHGGGGMAVWLRWTKTTVIWDAVLRHGGRQNETTFGVAGSVEFWLTLARQVPHDVIWAPTVQQTVDLAEKLERQMATEQAKAAMSGGGDMYRLANAERAAARLGSNG